MLGYSRVQLLQVCATVDIQNPALVDVVFT